MATNLSKKITTNKRPVKGSYNPAMSPTVKGPTFPAPEDILDDFTIDKIHVGTLYESNPGSGIVLASKLKLDDGSVTEPSLTFNSQDTLGLYKFGSNILGVASNGSSTTRLTGTGIATTELSVDGIVTNTVSARVGPGAFSTTIGFETLETTGNNDALTLGLATYGMIKQIVMTVDAGDGILTPTGLIGGTTITFGAVGNTATLIALGAGGWAVLSLNGAVLA